MKSVAGLVLRANDDDDDRPQALSFSFARSPIQLGVGRSRLVPHGMPATRTGYLVGADRLVTLRTLAAASGPGHVGDQGQDGQQAGEHPQHVKQTVHSGLTFLAPSSHCILWPL